MRICLSICPLSYVVVGGVDLDFRWRGENAGSLHRILDTKVEPLNLMMGRGNPILAQAKNYLKRQKKDWKQGKD